MSILRTANAIIREQRLVLDLLFTASSPDCRVNFIQAADMNSSNLSSIRHGVTTTCTPTWRLYDRSLYGRTQHGLRG